MDTVHNSDVPNPQTSLSLLVKELDALKRPNTARRMVFSKPFALLDTLIERMGEDAFRGGTMTTVPLDTARLHDTEARY
jgi:hypothetical protein